MCVRACIQDTLTCDFGRCQTSGEVREQVGPGHPGVVRSSAQRKGVLVVSYDILRSTCTLYPGRASRYPEETIRQRRHKRRVQSQAVSAYSSLQAFNPPRRATRAPRSKGRRPAVTGHNRHPAGFGDRAVPAQRRKRPSFHLRLLGRKGRRKMCEGLKTYMHIHRLSADEHFQLSSFRIQVEPVLCRRERKSAATAVERSARARASDDDNRQNGGLRGGGTGGTCRDGRLQAR